MKTEQPHDSSLTSGDDGPNVGNVIQEERQNTENVGQVHFQHGAQHQINQKSHTRRNQGFDADIPLDLVVNLAWFTKMYACNLTKCAQMSQLTFQRARRMGGLLKQEVQHDEEDQERIPNRINHDEEKLLHQISHWGYTQQGLTSVC